MTCWRQRVGEEGVEWLLTETIKAARRGKVVKAIRLFYAWMLCFSIADNNRRQSPLQQFRRFAVL